MSVKHADWDLQTVLNYGLLILGGVVMAQLIALCGKICSGKSTYAEKIRKENNAVVLVPDILLLTLFDENLGEKHDEIFEKVRTYLYQLAEKIINSGTDVVLDFGLWTHKERQNIRSFFDERSISISIHYVKTPIEIIKKNAEKRNTVRDGTNFYIDDGILDKCLGLFEEPNDTEIDSVIEKFSA